MGRHFKTKCYNHPDKEAVATCSRCSKALCKQCTKTSDERTYCKECFQIQTKQKLTPYRIVSASLGLLSTANSLIIGTYLVSTMLTLSQFPGMQHLLLQTYIAGISATTSSFILVYGSYLIWKNSSQKGGLMNFTAGIILTITYTYYAFLSQPPLLKWLNPIGYSIPSLAIISGILGISATKKNLFKTA